MARISIAPIKIHPLVGKPHWNNFIALRNSMEVARDLQRERPFIFGFYYRVNNVRVQ